VSTYNDSLWEIASADHQAEHDAGIMAAASVEAAPVLAFMIQAESSEDFENRLALMEDRIHAVASTVAGQGTPDYTAIVSTLPRQFFERWAVAHEARQAEAQKRNARRAYERNQARTKTAGCFAGGDCGHQLSDYPSLAAYQEAHPLSPQQDAENYIRDCFGAWGGTCPVGEEEGWFKSAPQWEVDPSLARKAFKEMEGDWFTKQGNTYVWSMTMGPSGNYFKDRYDDQGLAPGYKRSAGCRTAGHSILTNCWSCNATVSGWVNDDGTITTSCDACGHLTMIDGIITGASRRTAGIYCKTHEVWVGDGNAATHTDCAKEQRATNKTKDAAKRASWGYQPDGAYRDPSLSPQKPPADLYEKAKAYWGGAGAKEINPGHVFMADGFTYAFVQDEDGSWSMEANDGGGAEFRQTDGGDWEARGFYSDGWKKIGARKQAAVEYVVVDSTDDRVYTSDSDGVSFTKDTAKAFADRRNGFLKGSPTYSVRRLTEARRKVAWDDNIKGQYSISPDGTTVDVVWSSPEVGAEVVRRLKPLKNPSAADVAKALSGFITDSIDREGAFDLATQQFGLDYNDIYDAAFADGSQFYGSKVAGHRDPGFCDVCGQAIRPAPTKGYFTHYDSFLELAHQAVPNAPTVAWYAENAPEYLTVGASRRRTAADESNAWPPKEGGEATAGDPQAPPAAPGVPQEPGQPAQSAGGTAGAIAQGDVLLDAADGQPHSYEVTQVQDQGDSVLVDVTKDGAEQMQLQIPKTEQVNVLPSSGGSPDAPISAPEQVAPGTEGEAPADPAADPADPAADPAAPAEDAPFNPFAQSGGEKKPAEGEEAPEAEEGEEKPEAEEKPEEGGKPAPKAEKDDEDDDEEKKPPFGKKSRRRRRTAGGLGGIPDEMDDSHGFGPVCKSCRSGDHDRCEGGNCGCGSTDKAHTEGSRQATIDLGNGLVAILPKTASSQEAECIWCGKDIYFDSDGGDSWVHVMDSGVWCEDGEGGIAQPDQSTIKTAGDRPAPKGPAWFEENVYRTTPHSRGPKSGVPEDLFPDGIPLHGDLTPEQQAWLDKRGSRRTAMPNPVDLGVGVGSIFYTNWGYDQTNVEFFEVTRLTGASVEIREVAQNSESRGSGSDSVTPRKGEFIGEPMVRRIKSGWRGEPAIRIDDVRSGWLWDGTPKHRTSYGWGH
jgi:hypothetical protein